MDRNSVQWRGYIPAALNELGLPGGYPRRPLLPLDEQSASLVRQTLVKLGKVSNPAARRAQRLGMDPSKLRRCVYLLVASALAASPATWSQDFTTYWTVTHPKEASTDWRSFYAEAQRETLATRAAIPSELGIAYGPDVKQRLDVYLPKGELRKAPVLVFLHGGGNREGDRLQYGYVARPFAARGIISVVPSYRLQPNFPWPAQRDDAHAVLEWVYRHIGSYGGDPDRVYLAGHSAGSQLAAILSYRDAWLRARRLPSDLIKGTTLISGVSAKPWDGVTDPALRAELSVLENLSKPPAHNVIAVGALEATGGSDRRRLEIAKEMQARIEARGAQVDFIEPAGLDHASLIRSLGDEKSELFRSVLAMIAATPSGQPAYVRGPAGDAEHLQLVLVNGVRLAYRIAGSGVPVIFIHGEGYSHELWTKQIEPFSARYLFVSYDRRGHGVSDDPITGYSETAHAEDLSSLMAHLGIRQAHFVANSRGGAIIVQFLKLYPQKVRSITFADATIALAEITKDSAFYPAIARLNGPPPSLEQALAAREAAKKSSFTRVAQARPDTRAILNRMEDQFSPRVSMNPQRSDSGSPMHVGPWNTRDFPDMSQMHQPMLILNGELTDVFFIRGGKEAQRLWPSSRYQMIPKTDHLLMLEEPEAFNSAVLGFLAEVDAQVAGREKWVGQVPVRPEPAGSR